MAFQHSTPLHLDNATRFETSSLCSFQLSSNKANSDTRSPAASTISLGPRPESSHVRQLVKLFDLKEKPGVRTESCFSTTPSVVYKSRGCATTFVKLETAGDGFNIGDAAPQSRVQQLIEKLEKSLNFDRCNATRCLRRNDAFIPSSPLLSDIESSEARQTTQGLQNMGAAKNQRSPIINVTKNQQQNTFQTEFDTASEFSIDQVTLPEEAMYKSVVKVTKTATGVRFIVDINTFGTLDRNVASSHDGP